MHHDSDKERLARQEQALQFERFDRSDAWRLGETIRRICERRSVGLAIEIRLSRETVFFHSMQGSTASNTNWIRRKRNLVELTEHSSYANSDALRREGSTIEGRGLSAQDYAASGGSFPLFVRGCGCIGVVTVSGLPQREDHCLVVEALAECCGVPLSGVALDAATTVQDLSAVNEP